MKFDPVLIFAQIITLQCLMYFSFGLLLVMVVCPMFAIPVTTDLIFCSSLFDHESPHAITMASSLITSGLIGYGYILKYNRNFQGIFVNESGRKG